MKIICNIALGITLFSFSLIAAAQEKSFHQRAAELVSKMTLKEKATQMVNDAEAIPRLGIPAYRWWSECLHGVARSGECSVFPQSIGMAATFDDSLVYDVASAISDEARVLYKWAQETGNQSKYTGLTFYAPNINIYRDPRFGRGQETYGEDPFLTSNMGVAYVKGLQGNDPKYLKVAACAKHYTAYSGNATKESKSNYVTWHDLYQTYMPAFKALVQEGHVESVMGAYNMLNGVPSCCNKELLTNILRKEWGFKGYVTTDCGALWRFIRVYKVAKNPEEAAALALNSGVNLNCGHLFLSGLEQAVNDGLVKESTVDSLLTTLMETRFKLGLFDDPDKVPYNHIDPNVVDSPEHRALAYKSAAESFVLLENKNKTLPLGRDVHYVYVTGCNAANLQALIGNYFGVNDNMSSFLEGISKAMPKGNSIQYRPGVQLTKEAYNDWTTKEAPEADAVVVCLGLTNALEGESMDAIAADYKGENVKLSLPEAQINFLKKIRMNANKSGAKVIVVLTGGSPVILKEVSELADALIYTWYPGEEGGNALGDMLFGKIAPSGHTPVTFVKSVDQLPPFNNYSMSGRTYRFMKKTPLYPFGYGLSYTTFNYSGLKYDKKIKNGEDLKVEVTVKNTGSIKSDEVVQVYITNEDTEKITPIRQLCAYKRISLRPGESKIVKLTIPASSMGVMTEDSQSSNGDVMHFKNEIESGRFTFSVGNGQPLAKTANYLTGVFKVK